GNRYLLGYAHMKNTAWNVLVYSHADSTTTILITYAKSVLVLLIVIIITFSLLSYFIASRISLPLEKLAISTNAKDIGASLVYIKAINAWYAEADRLKKALFTHVKVMMERVDSLNEVALKDPLTGVNNRLGFSTKIQNNKYGAGASVIAIDVDFFKKINDSFGHGVGDEVLVSLAQIIKSCCRSEDIICRFGGEEFVVFLPNTSVVTAECVAERIREVAIKWSAAPDMTPQTVLYRRPVAQFSNFQPKIVSSWLILALFQANFLISGRSRLCPYQLVNSNQVRQGE
ncbi:TPA: GGDEF domain-containing protein, partial [Escherichia coli]